MRAWEAQTADVPDQTADVPDAGARRGPLNGLRVLELGQLLAGPFGGQLYADLGADVVKVEQPGRGDPMRQWGRSRPKGESLWWSIVARNKRSIAIDLRTEEGQALLRRLAGEVDIVIENFRPGTLEKWGLSYEALSAENPRLVLVRVSGYGQDGPYADRPGYGSIGEAMGGLRYVVGDPLTPPSRMGISIGDTLAALFATIGGLSAHIEATSSGRGQVVDTSIYESVLGVMESIVPEWAITGYQRERTGAVLPNVAPSNVYPTRDDQLILIAANMDTVFRRLCTAMGQPELADDPRYVDHAARGQRQEELDDLISQYTRQFDAAELEAVMIEHAVPVGKIYRPVDMLTDPQFLARRSIVDVFHPVIGQEIPMQNVTPRFSRTPGEIRWVGPPMGRDTDEILQESGLPAEETERLRGRGIVL